MKNNMILKFVIGAASYGLIEIMWRGYTHWTMVLTGGACFVTLGKIFEKTKRFGVIPMAVCGAAVITLFELIVGIAANLIFKMQVWDYSKMKGNFLGLICPQFSFLWFLLCLPLSFAARSKHTAG